MNFVNFLIRNYNLKDSVSNMFQTFSFLLPKFLFSKTKFLFDGYMREWPEGPGLYRPEPLSSEDGLEDGVDDLMDALSIRFGFVPVLPDAKVGPSGDAAQGDVELSVGEHRGVEHDADLKRRSSEYSKYRKTFLRVCPWALLTVRQYARRSGNCVRIKACEGSTSLSAGSSSNFVKMYLVPACGVVSSVQQIACGRVF